MKFFEFIRFLYKMKENYVKYSKIDQIIYIYL